MSSTQTTKHRSNCCWGQRHTGSRWTPLNIAAMVLGFICFWPLGLFMVFWIVSGRDVQDLPPLLRQFWDKVRGQASSGLNEDGSDNVVFNEYQKAQYDRIREIKDEIKERASRFHEFRQDAKRRADEEEFNRFMASSPIRND